jgi:hypothetical protein
MIRFACLCKHRFDVDDDMAGGMIQCPACGRLNDVPTLSDLPHLAEDGTYNVDVELPKDNPYRLAELAIVYSKGTSDAEGDEIDLRNAPEDFRTVGGDQDDDGYALKDDEGLSARLAAPRYDPETGELIRPIDLKPDPSAEPVDPRTVPLAKAAISYARGDASRVVTPLRAMLELMMPVNVMVMAVIFLFHLFFQVAAMVVLSGFFLVIVAPFIIAGLLIAHYGNVIDEVGVQERDELPRPLRDVSLRDDLWDPFVNVAAAFMLCYLPVAVVAAKTVALPPAVRLALVAVLFVVATAFLPAVLLTTTTSGTFLNLRPDRLIGVIRACGPGYAVAVLVFVLAAATYGFGMVAADLALLAAMGADAFMTMPRWAHWAVGYPLLTVGIYLAHFFCWYLGLLYRGHHHQFPWTLQRHVRDPATQVARFGLRGLPTSGAPGTPTPRKDTRTKLRELREADRRRRKAESQATPPATTPEG